MVIIHKNNKGGYLHRLQKYGRLRKVGLSHKTILNSDEEFSDRTPDPPPVEVKVDKQYQHTKVRREELVELYYQNNRYYVIVDENGQFVGFYSGSINEARLPTGHKFQRW